MEVGDYKYESSKISFRDRFVKSFYKFDEYNELVNTSVKSSVLYWFLLSLVIALLLTASEALAVIKPAEAFLKAVPKFEIREGRLITAEPLEFIYDRFTVRIDPNEADVEELRQDKDYMIGVFVSEKELLIENRKTVIKYIDEEIIDKGTLYKTVGLERFNGMNEEKLSENIVLGVVLVFAVLIICIITVSFLFVLFTALAVRCLSGAADTGGFGFGSSFKLSIYASTPAAVLITLILLVYEYIPFNLMWAAWPVCLGVLIFYRSKGLKNCKENRGLY